MNTTPSSPMVPTYPPTILTPSLVGRSFSNSNNNNKSCTPQSPQIVTPFSPFPPSLLEVNPSLEPNAMSCAFNEVETHVVASKNFPATGIGRTTPAAGSATAAAAAAITPSCLVTEEDRVSTSTKSNNSLTTSTTTNSPNNHSNNNNSNIFFSDVLDTNRTSLTSATASSSSSLSSSSAAAADSDMGLGSLDYSAITATISFSIPIAGTLHQFKNVLEQSKPMLRRTSSSSASAANQFIFDDNVSALKSGEPVFELPTAEETIPATRVDFRNLTEEFSFSSSSTFSGTSSSVRTFSSSSLLNLNNDEDESVTSLTESVDPSGILDLAELDTNANNIHLDEEDFSSEISYSIGTLDGSDDEEQEIEWTEEENKKGKKRKLNNVKIVTNSQPTGTGGKQKQKKGARQHNDAKSSTASAATTTTTTATKSKTKSVVTYAKTNLELDASLFEPIPEDLISPGECATAEERYRRRRLVNNISARNSRLKRKLQEQATRSQADQLRAENTALRKRIDTLEEEAAKLRALINNKMASK